MNTIFVKLRQGQGPLWGPLKNSARFILTCHLPVFTLTKPLFALLYTLHVFLRECFAWTARFFWNEPLFRSQCASIGAGLRMEQLPYIVGHGKITLGRDVRLSGKPSFGFGNRSDHDPSIAIGDGTFIGHGCGFGIARSITIGKHCLLAGGVSVRDFDGHSLDALDRRGHRPTPADAIKPVIIGDDVWIGAGAMILKGVTVGDRAVVGAGSVVTSDVPPDAVVAGNPARVVRLTTQRVAA